MRGYLAGILVGSVLGAAAAVYCLGEEKKVRRGLNKKTRQVIARTHKAGCRMKKMGGAAVHIVDQ